MLDTFLAENLWTILLVGLSVVFLWVCTRKPSGIPPGPGPVLPLIGNLLSMGKDPIKKFDVWRKQYGDVYSVYLGQRLAIILTGYDCLKEALVKRGEEFTYRPEVYVFDAACEGKGVIGTSGAIWKEQRRFALSTLRDFGLGRRLLEDKITEELAIFLKSLEKEKGHKFDFTPLIKASLSNIVVSMVFGQRYEYDDAVYNSYLSRVEENVQAAGNVAGMNFFPFAKYLPGDILGFHKFLRNIRYTENNFILPAIEKHLKEYDENNISDFIFAYIREIKLREQKGEETSFDVPNLQKTIGDLFLAGSDTTSTTLRWAVALLINHPDVQEKCFQEINDNIGLQRFPSMSDKVNLPYMEATITEIMRRADITPIAGFHTVNENIEFRGYTIPKGTLVLPALSTVLQDPTLFPEPEQFRPERFIDADGKFLKREEVIPFSIGKRNCIGEGMARMELFLYMTAMIQRFRFNKPNDEELPSLEPLQGLPRPPKRFSFVPVLRRDKSE